MVLETRDRFHPNSPLARFPEKLAAGLAKREIPALNGLRAVAVLLVVLYHAGLPAPGDFGVLIFFVLSGFLITWLMLQEYRKANGISLKNFYIRRSLRIFPAFYAYSVVLLAVEFSIHRRIDVPQMLASLLYVNDYYQAILGDPSTGFSHTWSLAVEEQFYLIWAPSLLVLLRRRRVLPTLVTAILSLWAYRFILVAKGVNPNYIYEAFDTRADHLLMGCLLAVLLFEGRCIAFFHWICRPWVSAVIVAGLVLLNMGEFRYGPIYRDTVAFTVEPVLVAMLIPGLISACGSVMGRVLDSPIVAGVGRLSYSIYLYQQLVVPAIDKALAAAPPVLRVSACMGGTLIAALASYYVIEKPFLRLKSRFSAA